LVSVNVVDGELVTNLCGALGSTTGNDTVKCEVNNDCWYFDGRVGLYLVVETTLAIHDSVNHKKGAEVLKLVSMSAEVDRDLILNKLLPDIARICPCKMRQFPILIQHDNAPPHKINDGKFRARCSDLGVDCRVIYQPAQSPDCNICNLIFFCHPKLVL
jgi:hypothetical protein